MINAGAGGVNKPQFPAFWVSPGRQIMPHPRGIACVHDLCSGAGTEGIRVNAVVTVYRDRYDCQNAPPDKASEP